MFSFCCGLNVDLKGASLEVKPDHGHIVIGDLMKVHISIALGEAGSNVHRVEMNDDRSGCDYGEIIRVYNGGGLVASFPPTMEGFKAALAHLE